MDALQNLKAYLDTRPGHGLVIKDDKHGSLQIHLTDEHGDVYRSGGSYSWCDDDLNYAIYNLLSSL